MQNKMNNFEKLEYKNYMNSLFDLYGSLLTQKQSEYFKSYYFDDLSLREIANDLNVSSNAVYDQIKNIEKALEKYESVLGLLKKQNEMSKIVGKISEEVTKINDNDVRDNFNSLLEELKEVESI